MRQPAQNNLTQPGKFRVSISPSTLVLKVTLKSSSLEGANVDSRPEYAPHVFVWPRNIFSQKLKVRKVNIKI